MSHRLRLVAIAVAAVIAWPLLAQDGTVVASGTGTVELEADRAIVNIAIESRGETASAAGIANAGVAAQVRAALGTIDLPMTAVTTAHYDIQTNWRRQDGERIPDGYRAVLSLRVAVNDVTRVGTIIDTALTGGATRVDGIEFSSSRAEAARAEAAALAVKDAMRTAEAIATAAGGSLGDVIELTTQGNVSPMPEVRRFRAVEAMAADVPTVVTPGALTISAYVNGRWRFEAR
ncbi:MAG: DUF541 domain-containing protein [Acidobacteria bacterium]|nr:DUF541 domain-containing protein [Acidobacteriota bacterium]